MGRLELYGQKAIQIGEKSYTINIASIGNPHCVVILDGISEDLTREIGPVVENHSMFPNRTNVQLVKVVDRRNIELEIWERGAGYTLASGTSSAAAAGVCYGLGHCDKKVIAHMRGGALDIEILENFEILQTGEVQKLISNGELSKEFAEQLTNNQY